MSRRGSQRQRQRMREQRHADAVTDKLLGINGGRFAPGDIVEHRASVDLSSGVPMPRRGVISGRAMGAEDTWWIIWDGAGHPSTIPGYLIDHTS